MWRDIKELPGFQISHDGRVINKKTGRLRKTHIHKDYESITIMPRKSNKTFWSTIHRLVAIAFIPNPLGMTHVDHIDRNPLNNHYTNLRWVNAKENMKNKLSENLCLYFNDTLNKWCIYNPSKRKYKSEYTFDTLDEAVIKMKEIYESLQV
jgi:hypothetical protein